MTSGELLFCSLLKTGYILVKDDVYGGAYVDFGYDDNGRSRKGVDMSKISQISFETGEYTFPGSVIWRNESTYTQNNFRRNIPFSISAPSGDNSHSMFEISANKGNDSLYCVVKVTSFTTTDGKVHTASNLNY